MTVSIREIELLQRERDLAVQEVELLRRELELLRATPRTDETLFARPSTKKWRDLKDLVLANTMEITTVLTDERNRQENYSLHTIFERSRSKGVAMQQIDRQSSEVVSFKSRLYGIKL